MAYFVAGTDTGVGKTVISAAIAHCLAQYGHRVAVMKPVASGAVETEAGLRSEDALLLQRYSNVALSYEQINPYLFSPAVAPHLAAKAAGTTIDPALLIKRLHSLEQHADEVIVEGIGGWQVPLNDRDCLSDWVVGLGMPVILVAGIRLGCLNHTLLTAESIKRSGLCMAAWVANHIEPDMQYGEENIEYLVSKLPAPLIARVPFMNTPNVEEIAGLINLELLSANTV